MFGDCISSSLHFSLIPVSFTHEDFTRGQTVKCDKVLQQVTCAWCRARHADTSRDVLDILSESRPLILSAWETCVRSPLCELRLQQCQQTVVHYKRIHRTNETPSCGHAVNGFPMRLRRRSWTSACCEPPFLKRRLVRRIRQCVVISQNNAKSRAS